MGADKFIEYAVKLLPSIRGHLDVVTAYFHADSVSDNDDDETSFIGVPIICRNSLSDVLQHLLDIIKMIFSWNEFSSSGNQSLLNEALEEFSPKITTGATLK